MNAEQFEIMVGRPQIRRLYRKGFGPQDHPYYDIDLVKGLNLIVGPCGSGKTRLLSDIKLYYKDLNKSPKPNGSWTTIQGTYDDGYVLGGGFYSDMRPDLKQLPFIDPDPSERSRSDISLGKMILAHLEDCISEVSPEDLVIIDDLSRYLTSDLAGKAIKKISSKRCQAVLTCNRIDFAIPERSQVIKLKGLSNDIVVESRELITKDNNKYRTGGWEHQ